MGFFCKSTTASSSYHRVLSQPSISMGLIWLLVVKSHVRQPWFVRGQRPIVSLGKKFVSLGLQGASATELIDEDEYIQGRANKIVVACLVCFAAAVVAHYVAHKAVVDSSTSQCDDNAEAEELMIQDGHVKPLLALERVDLAFDELKMTLETKRKGEKRFLLDGSIRGRAKPGRMLAIMGPSGAGKSTVLHALAGRIKDSPKLSLTGHRYLNGEPISGDSTLPVAFVEQDVTFFPHMTVRETLQFRVELKLSSLLGPEARAERVEELIDLVGLRKAADTIVGDNKVRGISGGERKRLSIAVEMISAPACIMLDEPTSGLDSTAATTLIQTLRDMADRGKTVIAVIHQPNQHVFSKFDDVLLVSEGKQMYFGDIAHVRSYMETHACPAPREMGTAEHILDCITRLPIEGESQEDCDRRMERLAKAAANKHVDLGLKARDAHIKHFVSVEHAGPSANIFKQFRLLLRRSFREVKRGKASLIIKTVQQVTIALVYGGIYSLGNDQASIQDRIGLLSLIAIGASNMACGQAIRAFPKEKAIVSNELASNMYRTLPYFVGKALSELPLVGLFNGLFGIIVYRLTGLSQAAGKFRRFLLLMGGHGLLSEAVGLLIGAISPNSDVALALFPAVIVLNVIFDGKNIAEENIPKLLRWIPKVGLIRWGFEGLAVNEFEGLEFVATGPRRGPIAKTGAEALSRFGLGSNSVGDVLKAQLLITASCWLLSWLGLALSKQRFLAMKQPDKKLETQSSR